MPRWAVFVLVSLATACGGGAEAVLDAVEPPAAPPPAPPQPQLPSVAGDVIGFPGADVPGLNATYVWTGLGWLGPDDDVVFEAVIRWRNSQDLGCGILRRAPNGQVNTVLMQGQPLPGTGGGRVMHPKLPLEARGDTLVIPALVDGGTIVQGLFAVPKTGGTPVLLATALAGEFVRAVITAGGDVVAEATDGQVTSVHVIPDAGPTVTLCDECAPGFSTDGQSVVVRADGGAWAYDLDGVGVPIVLLGDPAPGTNGLVTGIREAWVTETGAFVVHVFTDDPLRPDVLVRVTGGIDVLAACGEPAPGTTGTFDELSPAPGPGPDVVFGATVDGDLLRPAGVFCAPPGNAAELLASNADKPGDLDHALRIDTRQVVGGEGAQAAFRGLLFENGVQVGEGVFTTGPSGIERVATTDARVEVLTDATLVRFSDVPAGTRVTPGRALVHIGIREDRRPDATLNALLFR